ncbi:MAG: Gfo/Idh/MocA family oxidoreductase [Planctomycetota bacterium]|nr:Gfo/Idh/MocA family oxidoreductase [Planctomycetota bacterium]
MNRTISRRSVLKGFAQGGIGLLLLKNGLSARTYAANEKVNVAHVGCGGRGAELIGSFANAATIVAMCDVNKSKAQRVFEQFPNVPKFEDFRKMLDEKAKEIDAVVVATPDHIHAVASAAAMRAGKHVYTEKPLTRLVQEARVLRELAKKQKVATSMGNQGTGAGPYRRAMELIQNGALGPIKAVYVWNDQGGQGQKQAPEGEQKVPPYLNWDLWLGPTRERPFNTKWMNWGFWRDFGTAQLGNWASHTANLAFRAMKVDSLWYADPATKPLIKVEAKVDAINRLGFSRWEHVQWHIPARGDLPPITFHWVNGGGASPARAQIEEAMGRELDWGDKGEKKWKDWAGTLIVGGEGKIYATGHNATFTMLPEDKFKDVQQKEPEKLERSQGHERDWLIACKGGKPAWANYDFAGPLTEHNMLGNVATQFDGVLEFDPLECKILNNADADKALRYEYRQGWSL